MDLYKAIVAAIHEELKKINFLKKGQSFYLESGGNYAVISFQKSKESSSSCTVFTLNTGIFSKRLNQFNGGNDTVTYPEIEKCQWRARIGALLPGSPDLWWSISNPSDIVSCRNEIIHIIQKITLPELSMRLTDIGLVEQWINSDYAGTTEIGRFVYLTVLLKFFNDSRLTITIEEFLSKTKGKPNEKRALEHLKEIQVAW